MGGEQICETPAHGRVLIPAAAHRERGRVVRNDRVLRRVDGRRVGGRGHREDLVTDRRRVGDASATGDEHFDRLSVGDRVGAADRRVVDGQEILNVDRDGAPVPRRRERLGNVGAAAATGAVVELIAGARPGCSRWADDRDVLAVRQTVGGGEADPVQHPLPRLRIADRNPAPVQGHGDVGNARGRRSRGQRKRYDDGHCERREAAHQLLTFQLWMS